MQIHDVIQGTDQWLALREQFYSASDAPAMMGATKKKSRDQLLSEMKFGIKREFTEFQEKLLESGHGVESAIRPFIADHVVGDDLIPVVGSIEVDGLNRPLGASYDGLTMIESPAMECKLWNQEKLAYVEADQIPPDDFWQVVQQSVIGGRIPVIYVLTNGTPEQTAMVTYTATEDDEKKLIAGWKQFQADMEDHEHVVHEPAPVANAIMELPTLSIQLVGEVKQSNLTAYRQTALEFIASINTDLQTDQHFADAENMVKFCENAEKELEAAKKAALAQTASIDELFKTVDFIKEELRTKRLMLNNLVKNRKEAIRVEIKQKAEAALAAHIQKLNERLGQKYMPTITGDFVGVMKNKRNIESLHNAVNTELAARKIEANDIADRYEINLKALRELASDHKFLFNDTSDIIGKNPDDLVNLIKLRIADHEAAEKKKAEEAAERERERIRKEEQAKAEAEARARVQQEEAEKRQAAVEQQTASPSPVTQESSAAYVVETVTGLDFLQERSEPVKPAPAKSIHRPSDAEIIGVLATHYNVSTGVVTGWLTEMMKPWFNRESRTAEA